MAKISEFNERVGGLRERINASKQSAERGVADLSDSKRTVAEAMQLVIQAGHLLVEATTLHKSGTEAFKNGSAELAAILPEAESLFDGSDAAGILNGVKRYVEAYNVLAMRAQLSDDGLRHNIIDTEELRQDISGRHGMVGDLVRNGNARIDTATQLDAVLYRHSA